MEKFREERKSGNGLNLELICSGKGLMVHKQLATEKSEYIKEYLQNKPMSVKDFMKPKETITFENIEEGTMKRIFDFFYEEENVQVNKEEISKVLKAANTLKAGIVLEKLHDIVAQGFKNKEYSTETWLKLHKNLKDYPDNGLKRVLEKMICDKPKENIEIFKALDDASLRDILKHKAPIFRDSNGNMLMYDAYKFEYLKFIQDFYPNKSKALEMVEFIEGILAERKETKSDLFYGYPTDIFYYPKYFCYHPVDEFPRYDEKIKAYPKEPELWHLTKIDFSICEWRESPKIMGFQMHYKHRDTGEEYLSEVKDFSSDRPLAQFVLGDDEFITDIKMISGWVFDSLDLTTSKGKTQHFAGTEGGVHLDTNVRSIEVKPREGEPKGEIIVTGFYGFQYSMVTSVSKTVNDVILIFAGFYNMN